MSKRDKIMPEAKLLRYPPHMRGDYRRMNQNILNGKILCNQCGGTGNEMYSMYRKCPDCDGDGISKNKQ